MESPLRHVWQILQYWLKMVSLSVSGCTTPFCDTRSTFTFGFSGSGVSRCEKDVSQSPIPISNMWWMGLNHIVGDGHEPDAWPPFLLWQFQYAWVHVRGIMSRNWLLRNASVSKLWNSFVKLTILPTPVKYVYNGIGLAIYRSHSEFCKTGIVSFLFGPDRKSLSRIRPSKL